MEIERKKALINTVRTFVNFKDCVDYKDVTLMTGQINYFVVHFLDYDDLEKYVLLIKSLNEYDINDSLDIILIQYIFSIISSFVYNQYDVVCYKQLQKKVEKIRYRDKEIIIDKDIKELFLGDLPSEELLTIVRLSC